MSTATEPRRCANDWCPNGSEAVGYLCQRCDEEVRHEHNMRVDAAELAAHVAGALDSIRAAQRQVDDLCAGHVEYEGDTDMTHWLAEARRALNAVAAVNWRKGIGS